MIIYPNHPVRSDIMMQVVLKSYGYYEGQIDGHFGKCIKKFINFISIKQIILMQMELLEVKHVLYCLNKQNIVKKYKKTKTLYLKKILIIKTYSQEIYDAQIILKELGLYLSTIDGINGPWYKKRLKRISI